MLLRSWTLTPITQERKKPTRCVYMIWIPDQREWKRKRGFPIISFLFLSFPFVLLPLFFYFIFHFVDVSPNFVHTSTFLFLTFTQLKLIFLFQCSFLLGGHMFPEIMDNWATKIIESVVITIRTWVQLGFPFWASTFAQSFPFVINIC